MKQSKDNKFIPMTSVQSGKGHEVAKDVYYYTNQIVNIVFVGMPGEGNWVLIDAGMPKSSKEIIKAAEERFGENCPPSAIILTHGHFDHVGSIVELLEKWKVPVYAHLLEFPYLNGKLGYPEPDNTVQGGLLAKLSSIYPHKPINILEVLQQLPNDNSLPFLPEWKWIHTPGHSPGHVSFYRERDKILIAGDAFLTVKADSFYKVLLQKEEVNGPPKYFTTHWKAARTSVEKLNSLYPEIAITGHGKVMKGEELRVGLKKLIDEFDKMAIPAHGKFVHESDRKNPDK